MNGYLRCPMPGCTTTVTGLLHEHAVEVMTDHLIESHDLPEVSASYEAQLLLPICADPQAA
ncbi:hypothetical protein OG259_07860 [Streptomyces sp. NBC_00250]|uniref:hypothetical protein n=1 Tax=Streptomyces sp. NBC_00250 TaxID=2903641 RepID=UPI002E2B8D48|nr:hypothetical protein [Streptomyces sp. NBC_00250]